MSHPRWVSKNTGLFLSIPSSHGADENRTDLFCCSLCYRCIKKTATSSGPLYFKYFSICMWVCSTDSSPLLFLFSIKPMIPYSILWKLQRAGRHLFLIFNYVLIIVWEPVSQKMSCWRAGPKSKNKKNMDHHFAQKNYEWWYVSVKASGCWGG